MQPRSYIFFLALLLTTLISIPALAGITPLEQMKNLPGDWPPPGWQLTPPGSDSPYPPYIAAGEFSSTIYRQAGEQLWSAHVSITDQQTDKQSIRMLDNFPFCELSSHNDYPARSCGTMGGDLGRRGLAYAAGRYLVEISVIGPRPLDLPDLQLNLPTAGSNQTN